MDEKYIAIIGGLVGSGLTIITTKVLEYFQSGQTHKLALKKEFFLRKINVFEKTVSQMNIVHITVTNMAILIKTVNNENADFDEKQIEDIFTRLGNNMESIYKVTQETAGAIDLYIDLNHDDKEVEDTAEYWELLGTVNLLLQEINGDYDLLNTTNNDSEYQKIKKRIDLNETLVEQKINKLQELSNFIRKKLLSMTALMREELKKYN